MIIVLMGVAGAGKTTVGEALAARLGCGFADADRFHSPENVAKMRRGEGLTDADRTPWLGALNAAIRERQAKGETVVLACSSLKRTYRERLASGVPADELRFVYLAVDPQLAGERLRRRTGHFASESLVASQFEALELPTEAEAVLVDASLPVQEIVARIVAALPKSHQAAQRQHLIGH